IRHTISKRDWSSDVCSSDLTVTSGDVTVGSFISKTWSGGSGMATAIIVALLTGWIYTSVLAKGWRIKMPDSVPQGVSDTFSALRSEERRVGKSMRGVGPE